MGIMDKIFKMDVTEPVFRFVGQPPKTENEIKEVCYSIVNWAKKAHSASSFRYFVYTYTDMDWMAWTQFCKRYPELLKAQEHAKVILTNKLRQHMVADKNAMARSLLPLIDEEYKEWRREELRINKDKDQGFNGKLAEVLDFFKKENE